jgi:hypothetical protein
VQVDGLYGLAAHVSTAMYLTSPPPAGCAQAKFAGAPEVGTGPSVDVPAQPGPVTIAVQSGPTPKLGCYAVVPVVTLDADPHVRIAGAPGPDAATLIAGVDPNQSVKQRAKNDGSGTSLGFLVAMGVLGLALIVVLARVGYLAWRERNGSPEEGWSGLREGDPFELTGGVNPTDPEPVEWRLLH